MEGIGEAWRKVELDAAQLKRYQDIADCENESGKAQLIEKEMEAKAFKIQTMMGQHVSVNPIHHYFYGTSLHAT